MTQSKLKLVKNPAGEGVSLAVQRKGVPIGLLHHAPKGSGAQPQAKTTQIIKKGGQKFQVITKHVQSGPGGNKQIKLIQPAPMQQRGGQQQQQAQQQQTKQVRVTQSTIKTFTLPKMDKPPSLQPKVLRTTPVKQSEQMSSLRDKLQDQENIRESVRKTLMDHLLIRLKANDANDITLTSDEVGKLTTEIEMHLYKHFSATGPKYRAKYRSLMFNIKDPKNQTLWRRICEKSITPAQLVSKFVLSFCWF